MVSSKEMRLRLCDPNKKRLPLIKEQLRKKVITPWFDLTEKELNRCVLVSYFNRIVLIVARGIFFKNYLVKIVVVSVFVQELLCSSIFFIDDHHSITFVTGFANHLNLTTSNC